MGKLKFCANISWMFKEVPFLDRFQAAADAGFSSVEIAFPYDFSLSEMVTLKQNAGLEVVLINSGSIKTLGNAGNTKNSQLFKDEIDQAIEYAVGLGCKKIHIMAGKLAENVTKQQAQATFVENLKYAADKLYTHGIVGLVEPISSFSVPDYVVNTSVEAMDIIKQVGKENIRYQMDVFHLQTMEGNLTKKIKDNFSLVGHIQVSQVPQRNEPSSFGEINYSYIFQLLEELGYTGWIGCEYNPSSTTVKSIKWFQDYKSS